MGKLEKRSSIRKERTNLQRIILAAVAGAGALTAAVLVPNILGTIVKLGLIPNKRQKEYVSSSASKMVGRGLLKYNGKFYEMTSAGERLMRSWSFADFKLKKPKKWDGKWRVIISDISEKKRSSRDRARALFRSAGFYLLQKSVWVYPYDCEEVVALLKTDLRVGRDMLYMIVDEIENDKSLRKEFGLGDKFL